MQMFFSRGLVTKYMVTMLTSVVLDDCIKECATRTNCGLVLYNRMFKTCELHKNRAAEASNIVKRPGCIVVTEIEHTDTCNGASCASDIRECPVPITLHKGNVFGVNSSILVTSFPSRTIPMRVTCSGSTGEWTAVRTHCQGCRDCTDFQHRGYSGSGVVVVDDSISFPCSFDEKGHVWLIFQRRLDGSVNFYRNWTEYETGFGDLDGEFWLGLEKLYGILSSSPGQYVLRVDMEMFDDEQYYARYSTFDLTGASDNYRLTVSGYTGNAGNSLDFHNGMQFSTLDSDNDDLPGASCARAYLGAWWYNNCHQSNLNGKYYPNGDLIGEYAKHIHWSSLTTQYISLKRTEMKIRRLF